MPIEIIRQTDQLFDFREDWNRLSGGIPTRSWEWCVSWWEAYGSNSELRVFVVRDFSGSIVGIAPFYLARSAPLPELRFLGSGKVCSDFAAILAAPGQNDFVMDELLAAMRSSRGSTGRELATATIQCDGIREQDEWYSAWTTRLSHQQYRSRTRQLESAWRIPLPASIEDIPRLVHAHIKRKYKKASSRLEKQEAQFGIGTPDEVPELLIDFERLHMARQGRKGIVGCHADPRFGQFLSIVVPRLMESGRGRIAYLKQDDTIFALQLQLIGDAGVWMYQSGLDPSFERLEPGHLIITASLREAVANGFKFYDFMRGDEVYKCQWGGEQIPLVRKTFIPPALLPRLADTTSTWLRHVKNWMAPQKAPPTIVPATETTSAS